MVSKIEFLIVDFKTTTVLSANPGTQGNSKLRRENVKMMSISFIVKECWNFSKGYVSLSGRNFCILS